MDRELDTKRDLTTKELAELAGVDPSRIRQLLLAKKIEGYKRGRDWFIPYTEAKRWLESRKE